jgi:hypothetical protein
MVCRRLAAPPTDPCLHRVISILGETELDASLIDVDAAVDVTA